MHQCSQADYFTDRGSHVFACFVDFSKAFDRVNYFNKLLDDNVNCKIVRILAAWYSTQTCSVKWGGDVYGRSPFQLLCIDSLTADSRENIHLNIDRFSRHIVESLHYASYVSVPEAKHDCYKFLWDKEQSTLKQASVDSYNLWHAIGKPRCGSEFIVMKRVKAAYKLAIRTKENNSRNKFY